MTEYISYCAWSDMSATSFGSTCVNLGTSIPFDEEYKLTKSGNDLVGGNGNPAQVVGTADFFGTPRPMEGGVVTSTDIGCAQYVPSEVKSVRFEASPLKSSLSVTDGVKVYGAGCDKTVLYATGNEYSVVEMNGTGAYMEGICVSNSSSATGLLIFGRGGHFTHGRIVKCTGRVNQAGGGAQLNVSGAILSHSVIANNETKYTSTNLHPGGGVSVDGGWMDDCLVIWKSERMFRAVAESTGRAARSTTASPTVTRSTAVRRPRARSGVRSRLAGRLPEIARELAALFCDNRPVLILGAQFFVLSKVGLV